MSEPSESLVRPTEREFQINAVVPRQTMTLLLPDLMPPQFFNKNEIPFDENMIPNEESITETIDQSEVLSPWDSEEEENLRTDQPIWDISICAFAEEHDIVMKSSNSYESRTRVAANGNWISESS